MKICAIVTEYNPMHNGHLYQLQHVKNQLQVDAIVLIMSGSFVQRGEPALINKFDRAQAAVLSGVDLVIELPIAFATASAEFFAGYSIKLLDALGVVTHLNFGSELGEIEPLEEAARFLADEPLGYKHLLNEALSDGLSFPAAREQALRAYQDLHHCFSPKTLDSLISPNNILGIEYIKAILRSKSKIIPTTIKRQGASYHNPNSEEVMPSATAIRRHLEEGRNLEALAQKMPAASYQLLAENIQAKKGPIFPESLYPFLYFQLSKSQPEDLKELQDVTEGLENRLLKTLSPMRSYEHYLEDLKTKRFVRTKIARALLHVLLDLKKDTFWDLYHEMVPYLRVLAFNKTGQKILKAAKDLEGPSPIIVNTKDAYPTLTPRQKQSLDLDMLGTHFYNQLVYHQYKTPMDNDYTHPIRPTPLSDKRDSGN